MADQVNIATSTTQRAYTLRLRGAHKNDHSWRDALWTTHDAVNKGAKVFGDWLLTLRGGLEHTLADALVKSKVKPDREPTDAERRDRRILLSLSWLSVESAPKEGDTYTLFVVASGKESKSSCSEKVTQRLREILQRRGVQASEINGWVAACEASLSAEIRDDAAWIDRSGVFDQLCGKFTGLDRAYAAATVQSFFGSSDEYLSIPRSGSTDENEITGSATQSDSPEFRTLARQWISTNYGTGEKSDTSQISAALTKIAATNLSAFSGRSRNDLLAHLLTVLGAKSNDTDPDDALRIAVGWKTGRLSKGRLALQNLPSPTSIDDIRDLQKKLKEEADDKTSKATLREAPQWISAFQKTVEQACGIPFVANRNHIGEFSVMLDHAARRVSIGHSWIKRAEAERQEFKADAARLEAVPTEARAWLGDFCENRSGVSGALDTYRIRKRAVEGWKEVVARWSRAECKTCEDRIAAAREVHADPEIGKFGDIQLFEALAADEALCIWKVNGRADAQPLIDYVAGTDALAKQKRFKVPAYRHPDPLSHPVFCDFGNSRWDIRFSVHDARSQLANAKETVARREKELQKAQEQLDKAKTPEKQTNAKSKLNKASDDLNRARERVTWLSNQHALSMGLWNGGAINSREPLRWSCKRLTNDLGLRQGASDLHSIAVTRGDRLGRAAVGATTDSKVSILSVFDEKYWNGRLQAPREQLDAIAAHVKKHGWDKKARMMRDRIRWLVSFSAKLQPAGPWVEYQSGFSDGDSARPFVSRKGEFAVKHETNDKRTGQAKLILSRLPGLRLLSVDLGHRYAAACAVWEAISSEAMREACLEHGHAGPRESDLFIHLKREHPTRIVNSGRNKGKPVVETTIYRRIGADTLPHGKPHPAPWAVLDRQFLIKLPGEDQSARAASNNGDFSEMGMVDSLAVSLGLVADDKPDNRRGRAVDELMSRAVRVLTLGLKRHARRAKIAYALNPKTRTIPGMGGTEKTFTIGDDDHINLLVNALFDWHALASESKWNDKAARDLWNQHIAAIDGGWRVDDPRPADQAADEPTRQQRRKNDDKLRDERLKPIAQRLAHADRAAVHSAWCNRWHSDDGTPADHAANSKASGFHAHLRLITDWIMGRRLPGATSHGWRQNVGGLSLTRIATMKSLYQLHKAFAMRATPAKPRGAPEKGETNLGIARRILEAMEKMREQRVKQLSSRITAAALGLGGHWKQIERRDGKPLLESGDSPRWKWVEEPSPKYSPCHAVVIENLTNYRPEETRTRRENRQLMSWSSSKVKKYLSEACQLHDLHLREVQAGYTSRQDSRTGAPGVRCSTVLATDFLEKPWWRRAVNIAEKKISEKKSGGGDARDRYLKSLNDQLNALKQLGKPLPQSVLVPVNGGELFVSADAQSPAAKGLQADLNAAANIGLKALLDPDWPGKWWYVPCDSSTCNPHSEKTKGSHAIRSDRPLVPAKQPDSEGADSKSVKKATQGKSAKRQREIVNLWRDTSTAAIDASGNWQVAALYWNDVRCRVLNVLGKSNANALELPIESPATPW